jgi:hypothetical protein
MSIRLWSESVVRGRVGRKSGAYQSKFPASGSLQAPWQKLTTNAFTLDWMKVSFVLRSAQAAPDGKTEL